MNYKKNNYTHRIIEKKRQNMKSLNYLTIIIEFDIAPYYDSVK